MLKFIAAAYWCGTISFPRDYSLQDKHLHWETVLLGSWAVLAEQICSDSLSFGRDHSGLVIQSTPPPHQMQEFPPRGPADSHGAQASDLQ